MRKFHHRPAESGTSEARHTLYQVSMRAAPGKCCTAMGARSRGRLRVIPSWRRGYAAG